jgi:antitoxin ParD1/3/4
MLEGAMTSHVVNLPPDLQAKVEDRIASGAAADAVDVVRAGLEALDAADAAKLEAVRAKVARALADPRPSIPAEEAFGRVDALLDSLARR